MLLILGSTGYAAVMAYNSIFDRSLIADIENIDLRAKRPETAYNPVNSADLVKDVPEAPESAKVMDEAFDKFEVEVKSKV